MTTNPTGRGLPRTVRRTWQTAELEYLDSAYPLTPTPDIAETLNRSLPSVKMMAVKRGLLKDAAYVPTSQLQPGSTPWNKGLKGWKPQGSEKGHFQPGHMPVTAQRFAYYDGQVLAKKHKDGSHYKFRRISKGVWVPSHRYNWEQLYGPLPKGSLLRCRSNDTLNDDPANWQVLTRQQHASLNQVGTSNTPAKRLTTGFLAGSLTKGRPDLRSLVLAHPELLEAQRLRILLNRTLSHASSPQRNA